MATDVILPQWGMNMTEGTLNKWLKQEGDTVAEGEPIVEVETSKIDSELEAPVAGVLAHILIPEGETVPVGAILAIIGAPGEVIPRPATTVETPAAVSATLAPTSARAAAGARAPQVQVVPAARLLASKNGIDLATVVGSGPNGRILEADVQAMLGGGASGEVERVPLSTLRKTIAGRMLQAMQSMAPVTLMTEADVTAVRQLQAELVNRWRADRARPAEIIFLIKAVIRAIAEHREFNARLAGDFLQVFKDVNLGFAVSTERGLLVPVIRMASERSLLDLNALVHDLARKAQRNELSLDEVEGGTFTLTTLGQHDIDAFTPIILPPQVAILGAGRVVEKPVIYQGEIARRFMMTLSLTFDHRATDGEPAGRFLKQIKTSLEDPAWMLGEDPAASA